MYRDPLTGSIQEQPCEGKKEEERVSPGSVRSTKSLSSYTLSPEICGNYARDGASAASS